ncbi:Ycf51 family protein [Cylindrospermopsis raciborskii]|uniref:Ycf51 family protein n=1 Tax=Cylindrospermopsis raciborskii TaxID=77022 RepID=UPI0022CA5058|nr:Ycf51 family protein [Cylindrospermopsis raciborskii]MCZ2206883.1 Ycf51 family protein [Cylindrospermopsis raciborskii PAMP2011]
MPTTADFLQYSQWSGIATIALAALTILALLFKWGLRFRLVGATGFMLVLTVGLFSLSLVPLSRTVIPGAARYTLVYDNGSNQAVIATSPDITPTQLEATLRQAASNLYSYGRMGAGGNNSLTVRARTILHPESGISTPVYLGKVERTLVTREDPQMLVEVFLDKFPQLPPS